MKTNNNFHILIVDDEPFNIELAEIYLEEEGYQLSSANNAKEAFEVIYKNKIDLILLDINMPGKDGIEVCKMLKSEEKTKDIAIIFLTAQTDIDYITRAFEAGGADYLSKPFFGLELKARVKTQLQKIAYLAEVKHKQSKLAQLSVTDPLTKLHNSLYFDSMIKSYQNREEKFWIIYIKIDRFEKINKLYGLYTANKIIRKFSKLLEENTFKNSTIAKLYGVSFGIILKNYDVEQIKKLYNTIILAFNKDKEVGKIISFSTVLYNSQKTDEPIANIYKKLQLGIENISNSADEKYLFIK